jgi:hypothetical protein
MGQMAVGILYGCEAPDLPDDDGESPFYDIIDAFHKQFKIDWLGDKLKIRLECEGDKELLGVWVAVGGSGEDAAAYFTDICIPLFQVGNVYMKEITKARKLWERFVKWLAKKHKIELPIATLWITPCEVA